MYMWVLFSDYLQGMVDSDDYFYFVVSLNAFKLGTSF